jgi:hypothetical protein
MYTLKKKVVICFWFPRASGLTPACQTFFIFSILPIGTWAPSTVNPRSQRSTLNTRRWIPARQFFRISLSTVVYIGILALPFIDVFCVWCAIYGYCIVGILYPLIPVNPPQKKPTSPHQCLSVMETRNRSLFLALLLTVTTLAKLTTWVPQLAEKGIIHLHLRWLFIVRVQCSPQLLSCGCTLFFMQGKIFF